MSDRLSKKQQWQANVLADTRLTAVQKNFALAVASFAYGKKTECYPTYPDIAAKMGLRSLARLTAYGKAVEEVGAFTRSHTGTDGNRHDNYTYRLNLDWEPERLPEPVKEKKPIRRTPDHLDEEIADDEWL